MRFEDQPASGSQPSPGPPGAKPRRRAPRSWSVPAGTERFDKPLAGDDWARPTEAPSAPRPPLGRPRRAAEPPAPPGPGVDLSPLTSLLSDLRGELGQLRAALEASATAGDGSVVTGAELASTIEALGGMLGSGIAALLTEHRNLLARDIEGAAVRILEEVSQRLRTSGNQVVDGVEERVRHVNAKSLGDVVEQLDLRLDQIQADVTGLRAVMLEIPDQTAVVERLDQLAESTGSRGRETARLTPAMSAAIERAVNGPLERLEALLDDRIPEAGLSSDDRAALPDADTLEALTAEMLQLRRRITLRNDAHGDAVELSDRQLDDLADRIAARMAGGAPPAEQAAKRPAKRTAKRRT
jgi:hypothetical protein